MSTDTHSWLSVFKSIQNFSKLDFLARIVFTTNIFDILLVNVRGQL